MKHHLAPCVLIKLQKLEAVLFSKALRKQNYDPAMYARHQAAAVKQLQIFGHHSHGEMKFKSLPLNLDSPLNRVPERPPCCFSLVVLECPVSSGVSLLRIQAANSVNKPRVTLRAWVHILVDHLN